MVPETVGTLERAITRSVALARSHQLLEGNRCRQLSQLREQSFEASFKRILMLVETEQHLFACCLTASYLRWGFHQITLSISGPSEEPLAAFSNDPFKEGLDQPRLLTESLFCNAA